jgi:hypothetical protein
MDLPMISMILKSIILTYEEKRFLNKLVKILKKSAPDIKKK